MAVMVESPFLPRTVAITASVLLLASSLSASGAIVYTVPDEIYFQNFDSLPNTPQNTSLGNTVDGVGWVDDSATPAANQFSIPGWYLYHPGILPEGGVNGHQRVRIGAGSANTGAFWSYGVSGSTDRALGSVGSNTLAPSPGSQEIYIGLRITNETGVILDQITVSYNGEQWRDGGAATPVAQTMRFGWSTTALSISDPSLQFTDAPGLTFTSPVFTNTGSGAAVDGNTAGLVPMTALTISGVNWLPGTDLWLRWTDINDAGNDHGLAIDDLNFWASAIPEPTVAAMLGLGTLGLARRRRNRTD
jgi:hypothetical protein